jgi:hypothetical protein
MNIWCAGEIKLKYSTLTFMDKCLRRILNIKWINEVTKNCGELTKQKPIEIHIKGRIWNWIGHIT